MSITDHIDNQWPTARHGSSADDLGWIPAGLTRADLGLPGLDHGLAAGTLAATIREAGQPELAEHVDVEHEARGVAIGGMSPAQALQLAALIARSGWPAS
jgi:hypothetical protein